EQERATGERSYGRAKRDEGESRDECAAESEAARDGRRKYGHDAERDQRQCREQSEPGCGKTGSGADRLDERSDARQRSAQVDCDQEHAGGKQRIPPAGIVVRHVSAVAVEVRSKQGEAYYPESACRVQTGGRKRA